MRRLAVALLALGSAVVAPQVQAQEPSSPQTEYDAVKNRTTVKVTTGYLKPLPEGSLVDASYAYGGKTAKRPSGVLLCFWENHPDSVKWRGARAVAIRYGDQQKAYPIERQETDTIGEGETPTSYQELVYVTVPTADFIKIAQADGFDFQIGQTAKAVDKAHLEPFKKLAALIPASIASYRRSAAGEGLPQQIVDAQRKVALPSPPLDTPLPAKPRVILQTDKGPITLELDSAAAPLHVRSFLYLIGKGFYDGTQFHRFADLTGDGGNIIQGGDPFTKTAETREFAGTGGPGYEIPLEISNLQHDKLTIAAARSSDPDSAGSQFYICQNPVHFLDGQYTVFGKVVAGETAALTLRQGDTIKSASVVK